jgi:hypothetical protein
MAYRIQRTKDKSARHVFYHLQKPNFALSKSKGPNFRRSHKALFSRVSSSTTTLIGRNNREVWSLPAQHAYSHTRKIFCRHASKLRATRPPARSSSNLCKAARQPNLWCSDLRATHTCTYMLTCEYALFREVDYRRRGLRRRAAFNVCTYIIAHTGN